MMLAKRQFTRRMAIVSFSLWGCNVDAGVGFDPTFGGDDPADETSESGQVPPSGTTSGSATTSGGDGSPATTGSDVDDDPDTDGDPSTSDSNPSGTSTTGDEGFPDSEGSGAIEPDELPPLCPCPEDRDPSELWFTMFGFDEQGVLIRFDTDSWEERGRYRTQPPGEFGQPTGVARSLDGRAVAVGNRAGGAMMVWTDPSSCNPMNNGIPGLQTSTGDESLDWQEDDCVAWTLDFGYDKQTLVAWTPGVEPGSCAPEPDRVYTAGCVWGLGAGNMDDVVVHLVDPETGMVEDEADVLGFPCKNFNGGLTGAVDRRGDLWMVSGFNLSGGLLARVRRDSLLTSVYTAPFDSTYDVAIARDGKVWASAGSAVAGVFDPATEEWTVVTNPSVGNSISGIEQDALGRFWVNHVSVNGDVRGVLFWVDPATLEAREPSFFIREPLVGGAGLSIDARGGVWLFGLNSRTLARFDPADASLRTYPLQAGPQTSGDPTGMSLRNAICDP